jgi:hypothetical protein
MTTYSQPKMLGVQFDTIRSYPKDVLDQMELSIGDDCGVPKVEIPEDVQALLPCKLFRALDDIHWNQPAMRNLLLEHVETPLVLFIDVDMALPPGMMRKMLESGAALPRRRVIRFCLKHCSGPSAGSIDRSSPNTWFMHAADLRAVKGYDEDFCGHKGWSDCCLLDVLKAHYRIQHDPSLHADFHGIDEISDAAVTTLDRSTAHNKKIRIRKVKEARMVGGWIKWVRMLKRPNLRFRWERLL